MCLKALIFCWTSLPNIRTSSSAEYLFHIFIVHSSFLCSSCMIAHGHGDVKYVHYGLDFYPGDANRTVGSFAKILCDLDKLSVHS